MRRLSLHFDSVQTLPNAAEAASLAGSVNPDYANHPGVSYTNTRYFISKHPGVSHTTTRVFHTQTPGYFTIKHPGVSLANTGCFTYNHPGVWVSPLDLMHRLW